MPRYIGTCFRFYTQMRVEKKPKHMHIEFIVISHNSEGLIICSKKEIRFHFDFDFDLDITNRNIFKNLHKLVKHTVDLPPN